MAVALPIVTLGLAGPAAAWGGDDGGGNGGNNGCPAGTAAVTKISYLVNGTTTVTTINGNLRSGVSVSATFTIAPGCKNVRVSLVSYRAPSPTYDRNRANQQVVFDSATGTFTGGPHTLQIFVPAGFYQVDFALGAVITQLGPADTHNYYGDQGRLIDHDNGGTMSSGQAPLCNLSAIIAGPPKQLQVTIQDTGSGLKSIVVTTLTNATVVVPAFSPGTAQALLVVATKSDQAQPAFLGLQVTNLAGLVTNCDPGF